MNALTLRAAVLRVAHDPIVRRLVTDTTRGRRLARRFVAGETLGDAMAAARVLDGRGIGAMLDRLGEHVSSAEQAARAADHYVRALEAIGEAPELDASISVKLTQLGLDVSEETCLGNLERVAEAAADGGTLVMIDMESSDYVERTLRAHLALRERGHRVGVCLQAYLRRTSADVFRLPDGGAVRLVKGAYLEPRGIALRTRREVDRSYASLFATLIARGHNVHVATHDPRLIDGARRLVDRRGVSWARVEFQFLHGIRRDLQERLAGDGYPVRVYLPYGAQWYPYLIRRLAERPANMWFLLSNLVRRRG